METPNKETKYRVGIDAADGKSKSKCAMIDLTKVKILQKALVHIREPHIYPYQWWSDYRKHCLLTNEMYLYKVLKKVKQRYIPTHTQIQKRKAEIKRYEKEAQKAFMDLVTKGECKFPC